MGRFIDLTGQRFNRWVVVSKSPSVSGSAFWNCVCDCGTERVVSSHNLRSGGSNSCGCYHRERARDAQTKHGQCGKRPEYSIWKSIKTRCFNSSNRHYKNYGGRGITMSSKWKDSFEDFLIDVGDQPSPLHTIDRIDNNGNYEPGNVRWVTRKDQNRNKRNSRFYTYKGKTKLLMDWAEEYGVNVEVLHYRLNVKKLPFMEAVTRPLHKRG